MTAEEILDCLRACRPDTGNRYASASVRIRGKAAYDCWLDVCRAFAYRLHPEDVDRRVDFAEACERK